VTVFSYEERKKDANDHAHLVDIHILIHTNRVVIVVLWGGFG